MRALVTVGRFVRYARMNDLPAGVRVAREQGEAGDDSGVYRAILESTDQAFCTIEVAFDENQKPIDYRFLVISPAFERETGIENGAGRWMREIAPDQDQFWFDTYGRVALTGASERFENYSTPLGRWFSVYALKIRGAARVAILFDDITDRKRAEAALRASEERFRGFVNASADVVYRMSPDWAQMRQLDGQGFIDDTPVPTEDWMEKYILPEDRSLVQEAIDNAIRTKSELELEHRVIRADGTPGWTRSRAIPMLDEQGKITEWVGTASDITQAKGERDALRQSEERYHTLFEAIDSGFCLIEMIFDEDSRATDYRFIETNPAFERQSGLVDAVGRCIREFAPDLEEHWFELYGHVALTGEPMRVEGEVAPLGRWFDINAFRAGAPEQHRVAVLFQDITERKLAEAALQTSQKQFESLLNQAPLGVYLVDADFIIRQVNPIALPVFGDLPGGPIDRDFDEVMHILWDKTYADEVVSIFRHTLDTGEPYVTPERAEYRIDRNITEYYEWRLDRIPLSGGRYGIVCYFRDISAQVWARQEIEKQHEVARKSEAKFAALFDNMAEGFALFSVVRGPGGEIIDLTYREANKALEIQGGLDRAKTIGQPLSNVLTPSDAERWIPALARALDPGEPVTIEDYADTIDRWFEVSAYAHGENEITAFYRNITERKRAEKASRDNEERQAFLLNLSDALRTEPGAEAVADRAVRMLFDQLGLDRCYIGVFRLEEDRGELLHQVHDDSLSPMPDHVRLSDFPKAIEVVSGQTLVIDDIRGKEGLSDADRINIEALGTRAVITATLRKAKNTPLWSLVAGSKQPRAWTQGEISLVEEVAERTWAAVERARAEAARIKADQSFTRLFEASPAPFLVLAPDAPQFTITEVNKAYLAATVRTREDLVGRALFDAFPANPNEPDSASMSRLRASLERVLATRAPDELPGLKYDIPRPDGSFEERWWSPVNSPILDEKGEVEAIIHNANDVTMERRYERHQALLLAELQHRVRNILTMVRSVARRTADNCENLDDYVRHLDGRLGTLARMQAILTREPGRGVNLHLLVHDELNLQTASPARYEVEGPEVELSPKAAEVLSLAVHELTTNSIKYGVLADTSDTIRISWIVEQRDGRDWLRFNWHEPIKPRPRPARTGFGSELIMNRVPYELRGTGDIRFGLNLLEAVIAFPLVSEESKLEAAATSQGH